MEQHVGRALIESKTHPRVESGPKQTPSLLSASASNVVSWVYLGVLLGSLGNTHAFERYELPWRRYHNHLGQCRSADSGTYRNQRKSTKTSRTSHKGSSQNYLSDQSYD